MWPRSSEKAVQPGASHTTTGLDIMAIRVVGFFKGGYKIRKMIAQSTYPKEMIEFRVLD